MKPQTSYDSDLETAFLTIDGSIAAALNAKTDELEFYDSFTKEDESFYESLLVDEIASHNYHKSMMSTKYN